MKTFTSIIRNLLRLPKVLRKKDLYIAVQHSCRKISLGNDGANFSICTDNLPQNPIVYSFGAGMDISFDLELIHKFNATVYVCDPTPKSLAWLRTQNLPDKFVLSDFGLAHFDGITQFHLPQNPAYVSASIVKTNENTSETVEVKMKRLTSAMKEFMHLGIDILKMDIEGAEYEVIKDIASTLPDVKQIVIEFHHRIPNIGIEKTKQAIQTLNRIGYKIFDVSDTGEEISFIKINS